MQFLSRQGYFRFYLHRIGKAKTPDIIYCEGQQDDVDELGWSTLETIVEIMQTSEEARKHVAHYKEDIVRSKKVDLRRG